MRFYAAIVAATLSFVPSAVMAGDPIGNYEVVGTSPGGGSNYKGTVTVSKTGDTYKVIWVIGGDTSIGTGIGNDEFLTVSYKSGNDTGLALYSHDGSNWRGIWTYAGGKTLGTEKWTRE